MEPKQQIENLWFLHWLQNQTNTMIWLTPVSPIFATPLLNPSIKIPIHNQRPQNHCLPNFHAPDPNPKTERQRSFKTHPHTDTAIAFGLWRNKLIDMEERPETELISIPATPRVSTPEILTPTGQRSPRPGSKEAKSSTAWTPTSFISPRFLSPIGTPMKRVLINMKGYLEEVGHLTKLNPQDAWLPITESRNGNAHYAAFHNLNAGIGFQALLLPVAFAFLGWYSKPFNIFQNVLELFHSTYI